jgi:hypothetical protein
VAEDVRQKIGTDMAQRIGKQSQQQNAGGQGAQRGRVPGRDLVQK